MELSSPPKCPPVSLSTDGHCPQKKSSYACTDLPCSGFLDELFHAVTFSSFVMLPYSLDAPLQAISNNCFCVNSRTGLKVYTGPRAW